MCNIAASPHLLYGTAVGWGVRGGEGRCGWAGARGEPLTQTVSESGLRDGRAGALPAFGERLGRARLGRCWRCGPRGGQGSRTRGNAVACSPCARGGGGRGAVVAVRP